jgi:hypothetical protein
LFWSALDDFNSAVGRLVVQPTGSVALSTRRVIGIRVNYNFATYATPEGALGSNVDFCTLPAHLCDDVHGVVSFGSGRFAQNKQGVYYNDPSRLFQHELMHALGFGHGCYWPSIMMHRGGACMTAAVPPDVSVDDVAYMELVFRLATVLQRHPQAWHLEEALNGALRKR